MASDTPNAPDLNSDKPVGWTCPVCGFYCERDWLTCPMCDFVRPLDWKMDDERAAEQA
jgi:hypothetical protein